MDQLPPGADLSLIPVAAHPDPNYVPNLKGKGQLEDTTIAICSVIIALQVILLGIRFYTKIQAKLGLAFNDWCALVTAIFSFGLCFCQIFNRALGRHLWDISIALAMDATKAKVYFASFVLINPAVVLGKVTMLSLYLTIFGHVTKVRWSILVVYFLSLVLLFWTPLNAIKCAKPKGKPWGSPNPACEETYLYGIVQGAASLAIDVYILVLPAPIIMRLNLARSKRYGVLVIFLTGSLAVIADIIAIKFRVDLYSAKDPSWAGFLISLLAIVETSISVICSSMPTLAKFGRQHLFQWGYVVKIRSYFPSSSVPSVQPTAYPTPKLKRRPDPYSINMETENSVTQLQSNAYIELNDHEHRQPEKVKEMSKTASVDGWSIGHLERSAERLV